MGLGTTESESLVCSYSRYFDALPLDFTHHPKNFTGCRTWLKITPQIQTFSFTAEAYLSATFHPNISEFLSFIPSFVYFHCDDVWNQMTKHQITCCSKVHIFWEGHKILQNLHRSFVLHTASQIIGGDFAKLCGLIRIYELYHLDLRPK